MRLFLFIAPETADRNNSSHTEAGVTTPTNGTDTLDLPPSALLTPGYESDHAAAGLRVPLQTSAWLKTHDVAS